MAATAKKILADCRTAHDLLETESDAARFRLLWLSSVALLRSVGHVLAKVGSGCDLRIAEAVSAACKRWNADKESNAIFWDFIDEEPNNILKEYEIGFLSGPVDVLNQAISCSLSMTICSAQSPRAVLRGKTVATFWLRRSSGGRKSSMQSGHTQEVR